MRHLILAFSLLVGSVAPAAAQVSVGIDIGFHVPVFPELVVVPGYPVYYAPYADANYFFYDGVYWVYQGDTWYASSWYDGPWRPVRPERVPLYVLRVPVRYYRVPPPYFRGWHPEAPPRWGEHWGRGWERRHHGWDRWERADVPRPAPLPVYQREYRGDRYPRDWAQQRRIGGDAYRYRPRDAAAREHWAPPPRAYPPAPRPEPQRFAPAPRPEQRSAPEPRRGPGEPQRFAPAPEPRHDDRGRHGHEGRDDRREGDDDRGRGRR